MESQLPDAKWQFPSAESEIREPGSGGWSLEGHPYAGAAAPVVGRGSVPGVNAHELRFGCLSMDPPTTEGRPTRCCRSTAHWYCRLLPSGQAEGLHELSPGCTTLGLPAITKIPHPEGVLELVSENPAKRAFVASFIASFVDKDRDKDCDKVLRSLKNVSNAHR